MKIDNTKRWLCTNGHFSRGPDVTELSTTKTTGKKGADVDGIVCRFYCDCGMPTQPVRYYR